MKWILILAGALAALIGLLALVGWFLPREHRASTRAHFRASAGALFDVLTDVEGLAQWRAGMKSVRRIEPIGGKPAYVEDSQHGEITYAIELAEPAQKLVLRIADETLPYGGTWTFAFAPDTAGTSLTITEDGFIKNVFFRTLARFVFGYHATMESTLASLGKKFGETVTVERVE